MNRFIAFLFAMTLSGALVGGSSTQEPKPAGKPVRAAIETTLATSAKQIRQFAFDGDPNTYFLSSQNVGKSDHFTLTFDKPVAVKSIAAITGRPGGGDQLDEGALEVSADGKTFEELVKFSDGVARAQPNGRQIQAIRIQALADLKHPLAIREITIASDPAVAIFKWPVEYVIDRNDEPSMKPWFEKVAQLCEHEYSTIAEELKSPGFKPPTIVRLELKADYNGVAAAGGGRITGSVKYFKAHQDDVGAFLHETVHIIQDYRLPGNPGWLVEGIADYVRFYEWEPMKPKPLKPDQAKYNGSYRTTAAFLAFLTEKYDKDIVPKLNRIMREGEYKEEVFKVLTKKTVQELDQEWKESLKR